MQDCRGHDFDPWLGNQDPTGHMTWPKKKKHGKKRGQENHHIHTCFNLGNLQTHRLQDWLLRKGEGMTEWYVAVIKTVPLRLGYLTLN